MELYTYGRRSSSSAPLFFGLLAVFAIIAAFVILQLMRGVPAPEVTVTYPQSSVLGEARLPNLPEAGASVVAVEGLGVLGERAADEIRPIASVTKMMTAYVILKEHPLAPGDSGPVIEITQTEVDRFWEMVAQDQSVQGVAEGQPLSQLQLLQGMMIPSANNYAEILARWDAGSIEAFVEKMNREAQALGMTDTVYADVTGFSPDSISTASDQLILARAAMQDPVFAQTVGTAEVTLPGIGTVSNVNQLVGENGIIGIKTGFTEQAGTNLAFAARRDAAGQALNIIGLVLGQDGYEGAFAATQSILSALNNDLQLLRVVPAGQPVGAADPEWSEPVDIVVAQDVMMLVWPGMTMETVVEMGEISGSQEAGEQVGWLNIHIGQQEQRVPLTLASDLDGAGVLYKLTRF